MASCQSQELNVNYENIEINLPGSPGPWIKFNGKYYFYFKTDNDKFSSGSNHQFYIIGNNGRIDSQVKVPEQLQTFYYDLYIKNDTIFTTEYYDHNTFYLDLNKNSWIKTEKGSDLYYEDNEFKIYSLDFGEWGGVTWFEDKQTGKQYEIGATTPIVNKLNDDYYLTTGNSILKIEDPKKLDLSTEPYAYEKVVLEENYRREGNYSTNGAEILFKYEDDDYFNPQFSLATSFIADNKLYHLYKDSISTKIGIIKNNDLVPIETFQSVIRPFQWHYDTRNRIQDNNYQTVQFKTDHDNVYGIIEIDGRDIKITYFKNTFKEPVLGEDKMKIWFENTFDFYYSNFNELNLDQIDKVELDLNATELTQRHKISHYLLDGKDVQTPKIFRKIESSEVSLITMYYYATKEKNVELIKFEWGENKNKKRSIDDVVASMSNKSQTETIFKSKFEGISNYLQTKFGKPSSSITDNRSAEQKWIKNGVVIELEYNISSVELRLYKK